MKSPTNDIHVVVRQSNERTAKLCENLLSSVFKKSQISVVKEVPFEAALKKSYDIALDSGKQLTLNVDGDVILDPRKIELFLQKASAVTKEYYVIQPVIFDKILHKYRPAGVKLYKTKHIYSASKTLPSPGMTLRPESYTINIMAERGLAKINMKYPVGIHDFGQYFVDIFRKSYVHGQKHREIAISNIERLASLINIDPDCLICMAGMIEGIRSTETARIDAEYYRKMAHKALKYYDLPEKKQLDTAEEKELLDLAGNLETAFGAHYPTGSFDLLKYRMARHGLKGALRLYTEKFRRTAS